jgi:hypothetical protein
MSPFTNYVTPTVLGSSRLNRGLMSVSIESNHKHLDLTVAADVLQVGSGIVRDFVV